MYICITVKFHENAKISTQILLVNFSFSSLLIELIDIHRIVVCFLRISLVGKFHWSEKDTTELI